MKLSLSKIYLNILTEHRLYGKKVIQPMVKRLGDSSDETLNQLAIAGLFRDKFSPIQNIKTLEQLNSEFDNWYNDVIDTLYKQSKTFIDNKPLTTEYVDAYVNNIKGLGNEAKPFSLKTIEKTLVDVVNNNGWVNKQNLIQTKDIYNPDSRDIMYEDDEVVILNSNTKAKCVMYGQNESWCIGKANLNYYNTYRISYGATPYHVLQKNVKGTTHKVVIMHYGDGDYAIADRDNSDYNGGKTQSMDWSEIEYELPNLKGLEKYFPYREISGDEIKYSNLLKYKYGGGDLMEYIIHYTNGLIVNGSEVTPEDFIRDYAATGIKFTHDQLESLTESMIDILIEIGYFINNDIYTNKTISNILTKKQLKRHIKLKITNNMNLDEKEFNFSSNEIKLYYLKTTVIDNKDKQINGDYYSLQKYEYKYLTKDLKLIHLQNLIDNAINIETYEYLDFTNKQKSQYITNLRWNWGSLNDEMFEQTSDILKVKYASMIVSRRQSLNYRDYQYLDAKTKQEYLSDLVDDGEKLEEYEYNSLNDYQKLRYLRNILDYEGTLTPNEQSDYNDLNKKWPRA